MEYAIYGWYGYWWNISGDETNRMIYGRTLLSMDMPSIHGWWISMSGMQHIREFPTNHIVMDTWGPERGSKSESASKQSLRVRAVLPRLFLSSLLPFRQSIISSTISRLTAIDRSVASAISQHSRGLPAAGNQAHPRAGEMPRQKARKTGFPPPIPRSGSRKLRNGAS